jgi:uncharacterized protein YndB with AHSA1/START domain
MNHGDTREIVIDEVFQHTPGTIWKTLTTGTLVGRWLRMTPSGFEPVVGNRFTYQTTPAGAWDGVIHCEVLEVIPEQRFVYSWKGGDSSNGGRYGSALDTVVTHTLEEVDGGTRLRVVHAGFIIPHNDTAYRDMGEGWSQVVQTIGTLADEGTTEQ